MKPVIVFSDVDGTLLNHKTYNYRESREGILYLLNRDIPLIMVSSKTRSEMEVLRKTLGLPYPFIFENGSGIYFPPENVLFENEESVISLGVERKKLISFLEGLKQKALLVKKLSEMEDREISQRTGIDRGELPLLKAREFSEPFLISEEDINLIEEEAIRNDFLIQRGRRFYQITGKVSKGDAIKLLVQKFKSQDPITVGIGDSYNDISLFQAVDYPVLVQKEKGVYEDIKDFSGMTRAPYPGPKGFSWTIKEFLRRKLKYG